MKTTLDLNDELLVKAKALSGRERISLTRLIEEGLRLRIRARPQRTSSHGTKIPVYRGKGGLRPGINPCSNRSMLDAADDA